MKKSILLAGFAVTMMAASAQSVQKDEPPKPPPPPKPAVKKFKELPPPPPPVPSNATSPGSEPPPLPVDPPPPPAVAEMQAPEDYKAFMKRNSDVKGLSWKNDEITIHMQSGKEEHYILNDAQSRKSAEAKYGELPQKPPPPPPPAPPKAFKKRSVLS